MKIFISQRMRNKTHEQIIDERENIVVMLDVQLGVNNGYNSLFTRFCDYGYPLHEYEIIESYRPELAHNLHTTCTQLAHKNSITVLSQSLSLLADADVVFVPEQVINNINNALKIESTVDYCLGDDGEEYMDIGSQWPELDLTQSDKIRDCEFEYLIALSYKKKIYTYDDKYNLREVIV